MASAYASFEVEIARTRGFTALQYRALLDTAEAVMRLFDRDPHRWREATGSAAGNSPNRFPDVEEDFENGYDDE